MSSIPIIEKGKKLKDKLYNGYHYYKGTFWDIMNYTRFEKARIIGARALQVAMGAPLLNQIGGQYFDPVEVAFHEFMEGKLPITIKRS